MPATSITNRQLTQLLIALGFERGDVDAKNNCEWKHPEAGTKFFLPSNKLDEPALQIDIQPMRTRLDLNGHLGESDFDAFLKEGKLPQAF